MKKLTKILLIGCISLLLAFGFVGCKKDCEHVYDNACDVTCNECNEERTITHTWNAADCDTPKTCSVCGATDGNALGHTPNADDGDCTTEITCSDCQAITTAGKTAHDFSEVTYDDHYHYNKCSDCTVLENEEGEKHVFDNNHDCECGVTFTVKIDHNGMNFIVIKLYNAEDTLVYEFRESFRAGEVRAVTEYYYDENGNCTKENFTASDDFSSVSEYEYDENGNLTKETYTTSDDFSSVSEYEYDENGNCTKETCTNSDDSDYVSEYEYDENGNCTKQTYTYFDGYSSTNEYEYDENGNCTKETYTDSNDYSQVYEY